MHEARNLLLISKSIIGDRFPLKIGEGPLTTQQTFPINNVKPGLITSSKGKDFRRPGLLKYEKCRNFSPLISTKARKKEFGFDYVKTPGKAKPEIWKEGTRNLCKTLKIIKNEEEKVLSSTKRERTM